MYFWMDISRDDEGEVMSIVSGCDKCGFRDVTNNLPDAQHWVKEHGMKFHEATDSKAIKQIGEGTRVSKKVYTSRVTDGSQNRSRQPNHKLRAEMTELLTTNPEITIHQIAEATGRTYGSAWKYLDRMKTEGLITEHRLDGNTVWEVLEQPSEAPESVQATTTAPEDPKAVEGLSGLQLVNPFYGERPVLQGFGEHEEIYQRAGFKGHMGLDFGMALQPVLAAHDGVVEFAGDGGEWPTMGSAAGTCILLEGDGFKTGYAHLHHSYVAVGEKVAAGDVIGISGDTGATTGFHLHFELIPMPYNHGNGYAGRVDPTPYLPAIEAPHIEAPLQESTHE